MILLTTSLRPTKGIRTLCKDLERSIPTLGKLIRGKMSKYEIADEMVLVSAPKIIFVERWERGFGILEFFELRREKLAWVPPRIFISTVKFRREFGISRKPANASFVDGTDEKTEQIKRLLKKFAEMLDLPIATPSETSFEFDTVMRFTRSPKYLITISFHKHPSGVEIGPRIAIAKVDWKK